MCPSVDGLIQMSRLLTEDQIKLLEQVENLPDTALVDDDTTALIWGVSRWTVGRSDLPKVKVSDRRHRRRLGDIRAKLRGEFTTNTA